MMTLQKCPPPPPGYITNSTMVGWRSSVLGSMNEDCSSYKSLRDQFYNAQNVMTAVGDTVLEAMQARESELLAACKQVIFITHKASEVQERFITGLWKEKDEALTRGEQCTY